MREAEWGGENEERVAEMEVCERVCSTTFSLVPADRCIQTEEERQR